ncbi:MAG: hypothetical protein DI533_13340 [Cereibacter sphaeroides]|uniref:MFS transporter n=1 Tax=Cereibacter sphaeroides TaxID=1063 RepID=A0A2W5S0U8_CERSP|nr:MAG: hypothetical protein DI533_13340 [Cereibacter sphaeroides]
MTAALALILQQPTLRLIAVLIALTGAINASLYPYQSLIAIDRIGMSEGHYALVLLLASVAGVVAAVVAGVISDQRANRRMVALVTAAAGVAGPVLMLVSPGPLALVLCHGLLIPMSGSLFWQCFAMARLVCADRPDQRDAVLAVIRSLMSLAFLGVLVAWSLAFARGIGVMAVYDLGAVGALTILGLIWWVWPKDGQTHWPDRPSGLSLNQSLREIAKRPVLLRVIVLGAITSGSALYMVLISLVLSAAPGRGPSDVALFVGLVAGFEVPSMLLMPRLLGFASRNWLIAGGAICFAAFLLLIPILAPTPAIWALPILAGLAGGATLTLPIGYLQDLMDGRPGAGSALMSVQKVTADTICATVFAAGAGFTGFYTTAAMGALVVLAGAVLLLLVDRPSYRMVAR